jgi:hypothetical protein
LSDQAICTADEALKKPHLHIPLRGSRHKRAIRIPSGFYFARWITVAADNRGLILAIALQQGWANDINYFALN